MPPAAARPAFCAYCGTSIRIPPQARNKRFCSGEHKNLYHSQLRRLSREHTAATTAQPKDPQSNGH